MNSDQQARWHNPALLDHLARVRQPWDRLTRRIVQAVLAKYVREHTAPLPSRLVHIPREATAKERAEILVEIGAGGGQLREWLPPELATVTTHTEPSEPFVEAFRLRHPGASVFAADARSLPFASKSISAVFALCVLDTLPDLLTVRDELRRVLRPGGRVVHFLDLSTSPDTLFPELIAAGEIPLTNFARDPALVEGLSATQRALLPPADEFDEVLAIPWKAFTDLTGMLARTGHPLVAKLGPYANLHRPGGFDPDHFAQEFMAVSADPARLLSLNRALLSLTLGARGMRREWPLRAVSSRNHLRAKLRAVFAEEHGFTVDFAGPVSAWEGFTQRGCKTDEARCEPSEPFVLRHAGRTITRTGLRPIPGTPVEELEGTPPVAVAGAGVRATTVEVFVARRS
jgi:SAM-dependent methyltransferase